LFADLGCYVDKDGDRALSSSGGVDGYQTVDKCVTKCQIDQGMTYAGLEVILIVNI